MNISEQIAKHLREVYFGGNWTSVNLKDQLTDVSWQQATSQVYGLNTIAVLLNHMQYYLDVVGRVLDGEPLVGKDSESFTHPPIQNQEDWVYMQQQAWAAAENFACQIEQVPDSRLSEDFTDPKYGNYYRHLHGIIEHLHYHLGQIAIIKKIIRQDILG